MVLFTEMYLSELINIPVVDRLQEPVGRINDIFVLFGDRFPKVVGLLIKHVSDQKESVLLLSEVDLIGKKFVVTKVIKSRLAFTSPREGEIALVRDIMDKQIVDVDGVKVIRVNDIKLAMVDQEVRLIAVDVGFSGFLRRLGLEKITSWFLKLFHFNLPESLIGWDHVEPLKTDISKGLIAIPHQRASELHPADIAQIVSQVHSAERTAIFDSLSEKTAAEALHELEPHIGARIIQLLDTKKALRILEKMPIDEAADVLGDIPEDRREEFLRLMKVKKSAEIQKLLKHPDETAGGLMTTEFIAVPQTYTVEETINYLRETSPLAETIYYLYVVDENERLIGVLSLRSLIVNACDILVSDIMIKEPITVFPEMSNRIVAEVISKYNLLAVPVIDKDKKIMGIITVDDVIDFMLPPLSRRKREMLG
ncbi:hypothetical protein A3J90_03935 [candidate division WOR-1 bacterium RIFOXYC2_FULL_37_10]|nr:MAG: hypothetical protein A2246_06680 [candidate division WOR-1 bacterium RIFOXYA2_FULL_37_7]OGC32877.1 MAG: hypothetical protein A3J90_03935 [candidate division WOR-1 bacterium RIFOXYC2_FULL_37_10]